MSDRTILCLELDTVAIDMFAALRDAITQRGIVFRTLSEEQHRHLHNWLDRFAAMDNAARNADPFAPRSPEEIADRVADLGPDPVGCIVADDGTRLIGYTYFHRARRARTRTAPARVGPVSAPSAAVAVSQPP